MKFQTMIRTLSALAVGMLISSDPSAYGKDNNTLKAYLWKYRPIILFAQSPDNPAYQAILDSLSANQDEIAERHIVIIETFENGLVRIDGNLDKYLNAEPLRRRFSPQKGQLISILIGKDGGLKLRQKGSLHLGEITPSWLSFKLTQKVPESFYAGMILSYRLTPLPYTPINWITEITHVREPDFYFSN